MFKHGEASFIDCPDCAENPDAHFCHAYKTHDDRGAFYCPTCHGVFKLYNERGRA